MLLISHAHSAQNLRMRETYKMPASFGVLVTTRVLRLSNFIKFICHVVGQPQLSINLINVFFLSVFLELLKYCMVERKYFDVLKSFDDFSTNWTTYHLVFEKKIKTLGADCVTAMNKDTGGMDF